MRIYIGTWKDVWKNRQAELLVCQIENGNGPVILQKVKMPDSVSKVLVDRENRKLYVLISSDPLGCGGLLLIYQIKEDGTLREIQKKSTYGASPIDLVLKNNYLMIVNHGSTTNRVCRTKWKREREPVLEWIYDEASLVLFSRTAEGLVENFQDMYQFEGRGEISFFQESAAPHSIWMHPLGKEIYIPERGSDRISVFEIKNDRIEKKTELLETKGDGPRNVVVSENRRDVYVVDEIQPNISYFRMPETTPLQKISTLSGKTRARYDTDFREFTAPHPVALALSENEKFLYTLTRSADTISVFERDSERGFLSQIQEWKLSGKNPRELLVNGNDLFVILMDSECCVRLKVNSMTGLVEGEKRILDSVSGIATMDWER